MTHSHQTLTRAFEARELDNRQFGHRDHVAVAFDMLRTYDFIKAAARYSDSIKALAIQAGQPKKFNATITLAFLSLIAERMEAAGDLDYEDFIAGNPDLLSKDVLSRWYSPQRLRSDLARSVFLLPDGIP